MSANILVVDDEPHILEVLSVVLARAGYDVQTATSGQDALELFREQIPDVSLLDVRMPDMNGIELLSRIRETDPHAIVLMMTAYSTWEVAVEAMRLGAFNYIKKPFDNARLRSNIARALAQKHSARPSRDRTGTVLEALIGGTPKMEEVYQKIRSAAPTDITVLIEGESGTGKELVARALHFGSTRAEANFIAVNCAAFPETLLESEFFGYAKGAFTGATKDKKGLLDAAHDGTLFIDEIGEMPLSVQAKFLRVVEEGEFLSLGTTSAKRVDVRLIASTNRSLEKEAEAGAFRQDLFYRLNVMRIVVPPLRDRKEDIPLLSGHFLARCAGRVRKDIKGISQEAMSILMAYDWPGNVRELENTIETAVTLTSRNEISSADLASAKELPSSFSGGVGAGIALPVDLTARLEQVEIEHIKAALVETEGNLTKAAELLGLTFRSLRYRIKKLGIKN